MAQQEPTLVVRIDELVAHGIDRPTAVRLGGALERALARMIADEGTPVRATADIESLTLPDVHTRPGTSPESLGQSLAASLYQELGQSTGVPQP